jgi:hypothetical protein
MEMTPFGEEICKIVNNDCSREVVKKVKCSKVLSDIIDVFDISRTRTHNLSIN